MKTAKPMSLVEWLLLISLSILWGGTFFFNELAIVGFDPFSADFWRVGIVGFLLWGYLKLRGMSLPSKIKGWRAFLIIGALNNLIPFTLIFGVKRRSIAV